MPQETDLLYIIALTLVNGIGTRKTRAILEEFGSAEFLFKTPEKELRQIPQLHDRIITSIKDKSTLLRAEQELNFIRDHELDVITVLDKEYPNRLKHCTDAPALLYKKGNMRLNEERMIAIVGTRKATTYGISTVERIVEELKAYNVTIVSGLAVGIDGYAHQAALKHNMQNIAVLAHGLDRIYPNVHTSLAREMRNNGGVISEYMTQTNPDKGNFPERNRIVAGMCDAVIVVESQIKGGSMITAGIAHSYNRAVFAVPGKLTDRNSEGCNHLIKSQKALIYTGAKDLEYNLGWGKVKQTTKQPLQKQLFVDLQPEEEKLLKSLNTEQKIALEELCYETGLAPHQASVHLLSLEMSGLIRSLPGKYYQLI